MPSQLDYGIRIHLTEAARYFTTKTSAKAVVKIDNCKLFIRAILLKEKVLIAIEKALLSKPINFPFCADFAKYYSLEAGHVEQSIDISVKAGFEMCYVMFHKNTGNGIGNNINKLLFYS